MSYGVERLSARSEADVLDALRASFAQPLDDAFFAWKHLEGPWGATDGWVAVDDEGIAGVLCCMPWGLRRNGVEAVASRLVDGGTVPRALRRGIFGELVRHEVERCRSLPVPQSIFCTATPAARDSHVKRGAVALEPLRHGLGILSVHRAFASVVEDDAFDQYVAAPTSRLTTAWSPRAIRWRTDERSGHRYGAARLRHANDPNGIVYRVGSRRGLRLLFVELAWGSRRDVSALAAAVGLRRGCVLWSAPAGPGAGWPLQPVRWSGVSRLCSWPFSTNIEPMAELDDAALWLADVEGLI
jgi:Acetyltransferase (GNAT) domain